MLRARGIYRRWLTRYFSNITLAGLAPDDEPILLRKIFVPLVLTPERVSDYADETDLQKGGADLLIWLTEIGTEKVLFVSGEAGSGKTTLVSAVVDSLAGTVGDGFNRVFEGFVPFPIRLREAPLNELRSLDELVDWWLEEARREEPDLDPEAVRAFLDRGQGILLLDGLDEVGTVEQRTRVLEWLNHHWVPPSRAAASNLVLVTARPSGFEGLPKERHLPSHMIHVAPFSKNQIRTYLDCWFELRALRTGQRQETVQTLFERLTSPAQAQRLLPLARRPAYLASLAFVHGTRGDLPYTRAALYELLVDAYIEMLDRQRGLLDRAEKEEKLPAWDRLEKVEVLSAVAFQAHAGATKKEKESPRESDRRILWSREELEAAIGVAVKASAGRLRTIQPEHVGQLTDYFVARTGLLVETREGQYQFGHLSFQEYLTALFLLNRATASSYKAEELKRLLFPRLELPGWLEVGVLALAIDSSRSGGMGHQPVLALLDLGQPEQLAFLTQLLSGEEIRFTSVERRAWVIVWLGAWAVWEKGFSLDSVLRFPANRGFIEEAWRAVCRAMADGTSPVSALADLLGEAAPGEAPEVGSSDLDALLGGASPAALPDPIEAPRAVWERRFPSLPDDQDLAGSLLLLAPRRGGFSPSGSAEALAPVAGTVRLFNLSKEDKLLRPSWEQQSLRIWGVFEERIFSTMAERSPLLWWLEDDLMGLRALRLSSSVLTWRSNAWRQALQAEQCWRTSFILYPGEVESRVARARARARDLVGPQIWARDVDSDWSLAEVLARALDLDLDSARARARARDRSRLRTWAWDVDSDSDWALALALAQEQARGLEMDLTRVWARELDRALALARDLARNLIEELEKEKNSQTPAGGPTQRTRLQLLISALQALILAACAGSSHSFRRPEVAADLARFKDPEAMAEPLKGTPYFEQAGEEWQQVLDSPLSPVPLLEDALSREWAELPGKPDKIVASLKRALETLK